MAGARGLAAVLLLVAGLSACRSDAGPAPDDGPPAARDCVAAVIAG